MVDHPIQQYWILLVKYLRPQRGRVVLLTVFLLCTGVVNLLNPQIARFFIDTALAGGTQDVLLKIALFFFLVALANQVFTVITSYISEQVGWVATNTLRSDLVAHCLQLDLSFHKEHTPGELIERVNGDVEALENFFTRFIVNVLGNLIILGGVQLLLFREDWHIGMGILLLTITGILFLARKQHRAIPHWLKLRQWEADFSGFLGEQLLSTEEIRANGATGYVMQRFHQILQGWFPVKMKAHLTGYEMSMIGTATFTAVTIFALGLGGLLWQSDRFTIGTIYLLIRYIDLIRMPLEQIRTQLADLQQAGASVIRIKNLLHIKSKIQDGRDEVLPSGSLSLEFHNVSFSYDTEESILQNITFQLAPGKILGVLGHTGCGKSTLAKLLLRLYEPTDGEIRLEGIRLNDIKLATLRKHVGLVTQEVQLFQASLRNNLTFFNSTITDEKVRAVLADLGLTNWLETLPNGLDTVLGAGKGLSSGNAQLLAFARIFLADPGLIILDEATSRLDMATEQLIERALNKLVQDKTVIIIAHRLATVQRADHILILERGRILEQGKRSQLANNPASYFNQLLLVGHEMK